MDNLQQPNCICSRKIANKKTIKIGRMKVIKNIFCIVLKLSEERVFFDKYKKGITKIKI